MRVYKSEKEAGLDSQMNEAGSSTAFVTAQVQVGDIEKYFDGMSIAELMKATNTVQTVEELLGQEQPDLALVVAILVSTGWNLNDDVFTPEEVWKARSSALHKPMNDNHQADKILGHIVQTRVLDKSGTEIEVGSDEAIPIEFDIEVAGVLYRAFPELSDRVDEIITKAKAGEMFVSMEAWFPDFGYGLIDQKTGDTKLIDRTEATAFLTKHLRIYGGTGQYQGYRVGRVLKDIIFGAQAFVDKPANPDSVIKVAANKMVASKVFVTAELNELLEGGVEGMDKKELEKLQAELREVEASVKGKEQKIAELQKAAEEFSAKDYDRQIADLTTKVEELTTSVAEASEKTDATEVAKVELQKKLKEVTERAENGDAELEGIRKSEKARDRLTKLSEVKKIDDEDATLAELRDMTDETFEVVLKYAGEVKVDGDVGGDSETKNDSAEAKTNDKVTKKDEAEQMEAALNSVKENDDADLKGTADDRASQTTGWVAMASKLCNQEDEKEGGGE